MQGKEYPLSDEQIIAIRKRYAEGGISQRKLGEEYGVTQGVVYYLLRRRELGRSKATRFGVSSEARFWKSVEKTNYCWIWIKQKNRRGYGKFSLKNKTIAAHKYSYELVKGAVPDGLYVCHKCNNPSCVNPDHLYAGTNSQNTLDSVVSGTHRTAKLNFEMAQQIRKIYAGGGVTQKQIGEKYGVGGDIVSEIVNHKIWKEEDYQWRK